MAQKQKSSPSNLENCEEMDLELRPSDPERTRTRFQVNRVRTASMNGPEQPLTLLNIATENQESQNQNKNSVLENKESPKLNMGSVELKGKTSSKQNKELHGQDKNFIEIENINKSSIELNRPTASIMLNKESQEEEKYSKKQNKNLVPSASVGYAEQNKGLKDSSNARPSKQFVEFKKDEKLAEEFNLGSKETKEDLKFSGSDQRFTVPSNERHSVISLEPPPRKSINRLSRELSSSSSSGRLASDTLIKNSQEQLEPGNKFRVVPRVSIELRPIASEKRLSDRYSVELRNGKRRSTKINIEGNTDDDDDDDVHSATDTTRLHVETTNKSLRRMTREALPRLDNYRNIMSIQAANRPTLDELYNASTFPKNPSEQINQSNGGTSLANSEGSLKFGWIQGVLIRCLLNIWGVMLFLRLSWVVGQAGIGLSVILILTTTLVTSITALSMSAISTNGVIKGGGTYYMISRSLGPEFGGSIGLIFSLANAVACAMYVVGFCESLQDLAPHWPFQDRVNNIRVIGCVTLVLLTVIVVVGMKWEAKTQVVLLVILLVAILDFLIGCFMGPKNEEARAKGFLGFNSEVVWNNTMPDFRKHQGIDYDFFKVFAVFFPAATGILAGANISGDLKDPQTAIPKGTLLAILITTLSYILIAVLVGCTVNRDATGLIEDHLYFHQEFKFGLHHSFQVIELVSAEGSIIYAGCFAATLSSALASLVSAPKIFQALCKDKLYPRIEWFGKGFGSNNEPIRGYVLTFIIAVGFIVIGDLNAIAPLISNFFLAAYTLINFSTFHASLAKPVGWRPTFKYYNMWLSLVGAILCVIVMFLISWWTALLTFAVILALYLIVSYRKPNVNWGSTTQAQIYKNALQSAHQLNTVEDHVKNYRPQILVLTGMPSARPTLVQFAHMITKNLSVLICGHVNPDPLPQRIRTILTYKATGWLRAHKLKAFYQQIDGLGLRVGAKSLIASSGIGKLKPNILMIGFKSDWQSCPQEELVNYFEIIHDSFDMHLGVGILRIQEGLDVDRHPTEQDFEFAEISRNRTYSISQGSSSSEQSITNYNERVNISPAPNVDDDIKSIRPSKKSISESAPDLASVGDSTSKISPSFLKWGKGGARGTIDVWWLYDDGGLTLLLPYIISTRKSWAKCKLRVFALSNKKEQLEMEHRNMASLLAKFRIAFSDLQIVADITTKPSEESQKFFDNLIADFKHNEDESNNAESTDSSLQISEAELLANKDKSTRHIRLRELLLQHSSKATMVVITLPIPRKSIVSAPLYMAWLELLTKDMPPTLLVRGNQTSVLTFYS